MSSPIRQLTAIMFTDLVGFTSLMGSNEHKAMSVLKTNREIHKRIIKKHDGRWLKEMADGTLGSFHAVSDAVYCAGDIIVACNEQSIDIRIGIHLGDVIEEDGDIFGEGVNVASRLEPLALPNQIIVSAPIHRNIKNKSGITSTFIEEKQLKNVDEPVKIYSVEVKEFSGDDEEANYVTTKGSKPFLSRQMLIGLIAILAIVLGVSYFFNPLSEGESTLDAIEKTDIKKSIAILPFKDMSPDQDQEYLGDGIAEDIINRLTKVNDLKVIGRTSSFSFKEKDTDLITIGEMLGVETILEGSVQKSGNQLRITAQLINAEDGSHLWSEQFNREFSDVFSLQDEMALNIATKIHSDLKNSENLSISSNSNIDPEAYEYYLKGKHLHFEAEWSDKEKDLKNSENMFFEALKINPNYGLAHAGLADLYNTYVNNFDYELDSIELKKFRELQKAHIEKAFQLDPNSDYVNISKGNVHMEFGEIDSAYQCYVRAIKLNPNDEFNYEGLGYFLQTRGLYNEAALIYKKAKEINPLDTDILIRSSFVNSTLKNYEKAIEESEVVILLEPNNIGGYYRIFANLVLMNKIDEAEDFLEKAKNKFPETNLSFWEGLIYASKGEKEKALQIRKNKSWYYARLGMKEKYITTFLQEYAQAKLSEEVIFQNYIWIITRTTYDWIKDDPRIKKIVKEEKEKYEVMKEKYGNIDFLNL